MDRFPFAVFALEDQNRELPTLFPIANDSRRYCNQSKVLISRDWPGLSGIPGDSGAGIKGLRGWAGPGPAPAGVQKSLETRPENTLARGRNGLFSGDFTPFERPENPARERLSHGLSGSRVSASRPNGFSLGSPRGISTPSKTGGSVSRSGGSSAGQ